MDEKVILAKARDAIKAGKFGQAKTMLQSIEHNETAQKWLAKLEEREIDAALANKAPPVAKSGGMGCGKIMLILLGLSALACVGVVAVLVVALIVGSGVQEEEAIEANGGFGALDNPIGGETVIFDEFDVTVLEVVRPANALVEDMNFLNKGPDQGTEWVLIRYQIDCRKTGSDRCEGHEFNSRLVDADGAEWGEPGLGALALDPDLSPVDVVGGVSAEGWVGYEFPVAGDIVKLQVWENAGPKLYMVAP